MTNDLIVKDDSPASALQTYVFSNAKAFESAQRMATALSKSHLVPKDYRDNMPNALVALEVAQRIGASPLMVMQNLNVIHGRPSWSSQFIVAAINTCGRFKPLRFRIDRDEEETVFEYELFETEYVDRERKTKVTKHKTNLKNVKCVAWTVDDTGEILESPEVSMEMALREGWYDKAGSKWKTMPDLMLRYRAAAFFGRLYAPEVLMGMQTVEEAMDIQPMKDVTPPEESSVIANINKQAETESKKPRKKAKAEVSDSEISPVNTHLQAEEVAVAADDETGEVMEATGELVPEQIAVRLNDNGNPEWVDWCLRFTAAVEMAPDAAFLTELHNMHKAALTNFAVYNSVGAKDIDKAIKAKAAALTA